MRNLFQKLQSAISGAPVASKDDAKQRLKLLLIHDQVDLTPKQLDAMKDEIMEVIAKYCEIESDGVDIRLSREDGHIALVSNVPVRRVNTVRA